MQIADFFNSIAFGDKADVVSRAGEKVDLENSNDSNCIDKLLNIIEKYKKQGYLSIGIITKTNKIARNLYQRLQSFDDEISLIDDNIDVYDNKTCVISAFNSKGLEFDGVIIIDGEDYFRNDIDRNVLYVASTRALHKLTILSIGNPSDFVKKYKEKL
jgi:DNA helicase-2/ATP-dependent DNA helicase PcrA